MISIYIYIAIYRTGFILPNYYFNLLQDTYTYPVSKTPDQTAGLDYVSRMMMKKQQQQQANLKKQDGLDAQNDLPPSESTSE